MQINLDGLMVTDYTITMGLTTGRIPNDFVVYPKDLALRSQLEVSLRQSGLRYYPLGSGILVVCSGYPPEALAERVAIALESAGYTVTRQITEPGSLKKDLVQSFILF